MTSCTRLTIADGKTTHNHEFPGKPLPKLTAAKHPEFLFIRLLMLFPGSVNEKIKCTLFNTTTQNAKDDFEALSYVWGSQEDLVQIKVNELPFFITRNLWCALDTLRKEIASPITLWVDAICIDQSSVSEKNYTVAEMAHIYHAAKKAVVFLGQPKGDVEDAVRFLNYSFSTNQLLNGNWDMFASYINLQAGLLEILNQNWFR
jgi:hypothetical protein